MQPYEMIITQAAQLSMDEWDIIEDVDRLDAEHTTHIIRTVLNGLSVIATGVVCNGQIVEIHSIEMEQLD